MELAMITLGELADATVASTRLETGEHVLLVSDGVRFAVVRTGWGFVLQDHPTFAAARAAYDAAVLRRRFALAA